MIERKACTGCGACVSVCGNGAVAMEMDNEGFFYPKLNRELCVSCGKCKDICPEKADMHGNGERAFFGAKAKAEQTRLLGSSGGIFPLIAAEAVKNGGIVFGAALGNDGGVRHIGVSQLSDIGNITRSKYVQSSMDRVWHEAERFLNEGRQVLFCGTPCQTAAVSSYFAGRRENLLLLDLVCNGVPSPGIWLDYVKWLEKKYNGRFRSFSFRDKRMGDSGHTAAWYIGDREYVSSLYNDMFCTSYFRNVNVRRSCFQCRYCTAERVSDITLGDFWGIENVRPGFDDGMGCSVVICHTQAGRKMWNKIMDKTEWFTCQENDAANAAQPRLRTPPKPARSRNFFLWLYRWLPFSIWIRLFGR